MSERNDIHRPSAIIPTDYVFVAFENVPGAGSYGSWDYAACVEQNYNRKLIRDHMERTGGKYSDHSHGGNCMVCGSVNAVWTVLFYHEKTNTYVRMGSDCAEKCEMAYSNGDLDAFKTSMKAAAELAAGKKKAIAKLEELDLSECWTIYEADYSLDSLKTAKYEELTIRDIVGKLVKYGSVSEAQVNFLRSLLTKIENRAEREAKFAAEKAAALPVPEGRVNITGTILKAEMKETQFGNVMKIVVKSADGWVVWGTCPSNIAPERGMKVSFTATIKVSPSDPKFGFFSRPIAAVELSKAA